MASTTADQNKELARRDIEEVWNEGNLELIEELYADDFVLHDPAYPDDVRGPNGQKEFVSTYNTAFPGTPSITVEELVTEGDVVTIRWTGRGTHEAKFLGIEPTHEDIEVTGMSMARIDDGKIAEMWTNYDALGLLGQIGAVEPPTQ